MSQSATPGSRSERTRAAILSAAEAVFAERGFAATRLEEVAERVGIRRASIVYYFRDKRELYDAVLGDVFEGLRVRLAGALRGPAPVEQRIEAAVAAWVDYVGERPTIARLILREVADATPEHRPDMLRHTRPFFDLIEKGILASPDIDDARLHAVDPVHIASTIAGATIFFVAAIPTLVPELGVDPVSDEHLAVHKEEVLRILRRLLGTRGPRRA
jgi:TetR/AcrR family transcriptional regulator